MGAEDELGRGPGAPGSGVQAAGGLAADGAAKAAQAVATAVGSPVVGKVVGAAVGSRTGRRVLAVAAAAALVLVGTVLGMITGLVTAGGTLIAGAAVADDGTDQTAQEEEVAALGWGGVCAPTTSSITLNEAQLDAARAIIATGTAKGVSGYGLVIALAVAISQPEGVTDTGFDAAAFYDALLAVPDWQTMSVNEAGQSAAPSPFPDEYGARQVQATAVVELTTGAKVVTPGCSGSGDGAWVLPLPVRSFSRSSPYGMRFHPTLHINRLHDGVDLRAAKDTPVYAVADGVVDDAPTGAGERGNAVYITHPDGIRTLYQHLNTIGVSVGQQVIAGEQIGTVGNTGVSSGGKLISTGYHLHFTVYVHGKSTDPEPFLQSKGVKCCVDMGW